MNTRLPLRMLLLCAAVMVGLVACSRSESTAKNGDDGVDYYTCTMHPSVRSHDANDKCPVCGMDLVAVKKRSVADAGPPQAAAVAPGAGAGSPGTPPEGDKPSEFTVPVEQQQMIGVTYARVERTPLKGSVRTVGTVEAEMPLHWDYVARIDGYVHDLRVISPGDSVKKGQVLMDLYSPDLLSTQNEYIDLLRMRDAGEKSGSPAAAENARHLIASARERLLQWNISEEQIDLLESSRQAKQFLTLVAPQDGVVEAIPVHQGRHVSVGDHLVDLVDLSSVWVWAEFYQEELSLLKPGVAVALTTSAYPGQTLEGKIALVDPFMDATRRTSRVRIDVPNPGGRLRPDMYVDVELSIDQGQGLTIPVSAVLPTGRHTIVFVDKGEGRLEPRFIEVGRKFGDRFEVTRGLAENERIVSSANFLVDAESKVQGALKSW